MRCAVSVATVQQAIATQQFGSLRNCAGEFFPHSLLNDMAQKTGGVGERDVFETFLGVQ